MNLEEILAARREVVKRTIRPIDAAEAAAIGEAVFVFPDDPWRDQFFTYLAENPDAEIFHAEVPEGGQLIYSHTNHRGIWFIPGKGKGIIQPKALEFLAEIVDDQA